MKVKELIKELNKIKDKELEVYIWDSEDDIKEISMVDDGLDDRVDINIKED